MNSKYFYKFIVLFSFLSISCQQFEKNAFICTENGQFRDAENRHMILNGLNHVNKNPKENYLNPDDESLFREFKSYGFNCIRFGLNWGALEPEPGKYNEQYLHEIDKRVEWAAENNLFLLLDMHQDSYGIKFGGGAPMWAILDEDLPHISGEVWSDAYLISPAVHKAFDNFWKNKPASDGVGIRDHYISLWAYLAKRYAQCNSIIGFDIMNEPFPDAGAEQIMPTLLSSYAKEISSIHEFSVEELAEMWENENNRALALEYLNHEEIYNKVLLSVVEIVGKFEEGTLSNFYQEVRDSIRKVNKNHIIFLEHNYFCNMGVKSTFKVPLDENGNLDSLCAYAPHAYDLVTDTRNAQNPGENRVNFIFKQIHKAAQEKAVPVLLGEWGAFYLGEISYISPAQQIISIIQDNLYGQTYWAYWPKIETQDYFKLLTRAYPMAINGTILKYKHDFEKNGFSCTWIEGNNKSKNCFYIPDMTKVINLQVTPKSEIEFHKIENSESGYLRIHPIEENIHRSLHFTIEKPDI